MKKLLVWDGDETLWNGTLMHGDKPVLPEGRMELCQNLYDRGVLQSIASRNLPEDLERAVHELGLTRFFLHNIASLKMAKGEMVKWIMENYGLTKAEEVVFVDDNSTNCYDVTQQVPGVLALVYPVQDLDHLFPGGDLTDEARNRVEMYRSEMMRKQSGASFSGDKLDFLRSCGMEATVRKAKEEDVPRIMDLALRANQMSASSIVQTEGTVQRYMDKGQLYVLTARDNFGEYGLTGVIGCSETGVLTLMVISCRLQGKGYGSAFLGTMINCFVKNNSGKSLVATWSETKYNSGVRSLYEWYKFYISISENGVCTATSPPFLVTLPDWISITLDI